MSTGDIIFLTAALTSILGSIPFMAWFLWYWKCRASPEFKQAFPYDKPREFNGGLLAMLWPIYLVVIILFIRGERKS